MSDGAARQQIIDQINDVDNILVTVSRNPSVDALSAALGLTLIINKLNKHGTAVFSGDIPPAITFLDPEKTFENTVDSLRDFIIALDKEKADHLRYKVDGDMVKIFITPYRTTISDKDLDYSQGDYNVELVIAIGVENSDELDAALANHGRILHDATVASIGIGQTETNLGSINWHERRASSYSELMASIGEGLRSDKSLFDEQSASAFLTGIVAATDRFSNDNTTADAMTVAAKLMAAGANQQLIAAKLEQASEIAPEVPTKRDGTTDLKDGQPTKINRKNRKKNKQSAQPDEPVKDRPAADGTMTISHEKRGNVDEVGKQVHEENQQAAAEHAEQSLRQHQELAELTLPEVKADSQPSETGSSDQSESTPDSATQEEALAKDLALASADTPSSAAIPSVADLQKDLADAQNELDEAAPPAPTGDMVLPEPAKTTAAPAEPTLGGTLNATSQQAADDQRRQQADDRNKTILTHNSAPLPDNSGSIPAVNSFSQKDANTEPASVDPFGGTSPTVHGQTIDPLTPAPAAVPVDTQAAPATTNPTLAQIDSDNRGAHDDARAAIDAAFASDAPAAPAQAPTIDASSLPPLPPLPPMPTDFSQLPPLPNAPATPSPEDQLGAMLPPAPAPATPPSPAAPADPGQFQIPGSR